jgi:hypothetical protein
MEDIEVQPGSSCGAPIGYRVTGSPSTPGTGASPMK